MSDEKKPEPETSTEPKPDAPEEDAPKADAPTPKDEAALESNETEEEDEDEDEDEDDPANIEAIAKRVAAIDEGDETERIAREEEAKLAERRRRLKKKGGGLEKSASKRLAKIGAKAKPKRAIPDAVEAADPLIERTQKIGDWARKNRSTVQALVAAAVLAAIGVSVWGYLSHKKSAEASVALAQAVADERGEIGDPEKEDEDAIRDKTPMFKTVDERRDAALAKYRDVVQKFGGTGAAWLARLGEGSILLDKRDAEGAIAAFNDVLDSSLGHADTEVRNRALENLGFAYELLAETKPEARNANLDKAIEQYKAMQTGDVLGFKEMAQYNEARCEQNKGDKAKAIETLKALREELMKSTDSRLFNTLKELTEDRLRALDPTSVPQKRPHIGAGGGQLSPEVLEKLPPELRERLMNGGGGGPE